MLKIKQLCFLLLAVLVLVKINASRSPEFENLSGQYGNKSTNLIELLLIKDQLANETGINVDVPPFLAISHRTIKEWLRDSLVEPVHDEPRAWYQVLEHWKNFQKAQRGFTVLQEKSHQELEFIQEIIKKCFKTKSTAKNRGLCFLNYSTASFNFPRKTLTKSRIFVRVPRFKELGNVRLA